MKSYEMLKDRLNKFATQKSSLFFSPSYKRLVQFLLESLQPDMNVRELAELLAKIESIPVKSYRFVSILTGENRRVLSDFVISTPATAVSDPEMKPLGLSATMVKKALTDGLSEIKQVQTKPLSPAYNQDLIACLVDVHEKLLNIMEKNLGKANSIDFPPQTIVTYSNEDIKTTENLKEIEKASIKKELPDKANIIFDLIRKTVLIEGKVVSGTPKELKEKIESFTKDKIETPGSMANKIFNFGGQFLMGVLTTEFMQTSELNKKTFQPQICHGHINWQKTADGHIVVEVLVNVYSIIKNEDHEEKIFILDTDGENLVELDLVNPRGEKILSQLLSEVTQTPCLRPPVGYIKGVIQLVQGANQQYYLRPTKIDTAYYTNEIENIKAITPSLSSPSVP